MFIMRGRETGNLNLDCKFPRALTLEECFEKVIQNENGSYTGLHKLIANPEFLSIAYNNLRKNKGLDTVGVDGATLDGINHGFFNNLGKDIHTGKYKPKPVRRIYIDKPNGKKRPLGVPSAIDKIPQEAIRIILERIYEPKFLPNSHGFRKKMSCHTALNYYKMRFQGVS
jgi:retron-type reverse transcriptase